MKTLLMKKEEVKHGWVVVDVKDKVLGRAAAQIADILRGKNKPTYTPNVDTGDFVVVVNAAQVKLTGKKLEDKIYYRHSHYIGGIKSVSAEKLLAKHPERLITHAVKGMLPKNDLARRIIKKLKVYSGADHPHSANSPKEITLNY
jgi:large subunit ribosomal protein L13